jgi:hypothetical protein
MILVHRRHNVDLIVHHDEKIQSSYGLYHFLRGEFFDGFASNFIFTPSSRFWLPLHKVCLYCDAKGPTGARAHDVHHFVSPHLDSRSTCSFYKVVAAGITDYAAIPRQPVMPLVKKENVVPIALEEREASAAGAKF